MKMYTFLCAVLLAISASLIHPMDNPTKNDPAASASTPQPQAASELQSKAYYAKCPVCYFIARSRPGFLKHTNTKHSNDKVFKCENKECADKLFTPAELQGHHMKHTINRTNVAYEHLCTVPGCFKIFREESQLNEHIKCHKEQPPFSTNLITMEKSSAAAAAGSTSQAQKNKRKNKTTPSARPTKRNKPSVLVPTNSTQSTTTAPLESLIAQSFQMEDTELTPLTLQELDNPKNLTQEGLKKITTETADPFDGLEPIADVSEFSNPLSSAASTIEYPTYESLALPTSENSAPHWQDARLQHYENQQSAPVVALPQSPTHDQMMPPVNPSNDFSELPLPDPAIAPNSSVMQQTQQKIKTYAAKKHKRIIRTSPADVALEDSSQDSNQENEINKDNTDQEAVRSIADKQKKVSCNMCGREFGKNNTLNRHINTVHKAIKRYKSEYCNLAFGQRSHLESHLKLVHPKKNFECHTCKEKFTIKDNLKKHLKTKTHVEKDNEQKILKTNSLEQRLQKKSRLKQNATNKGGGGGSDDE